MTIIVNTTLNRVIMSYKEMSTSQWITILMDINHATTGLIGFDKYIPKNGFHKLCAEVWITRHIMMIVDSYEKLGIEIPTETMELIKKHSK